MTPICLAILADIHGVFPSLEQALDEILADPPDAFIVAGDFVGGPQPHETLARLRELDSAFIESGFLRVIYPLGRALLESIATGEDVPNALLTTAQSRGEAAGLDVSEGVPDEIYLETGETFPWEIDFDLEEDDGEA